MRPALTTVRLLTGRDGTVTGALIATGGGRVLLRAGLARRTVLPPPLGGKHLDEHLVARADDARWARVADVLVACRGAEDLVGRRFPGRALTVAPGRRGEAVVVGRDGGAIALRGPVRLCGSFAHALLTAGVPLDALRSAVLTAVGPAGQAGEPPPGPVPSRAAS